MHTTSADRMSGLYGHPGETAGMVVSREEPDTTGFKAEAERFLAEKLKRMTLRGDTIERPRSSAIAADVRILPILRDEAQERWRSLAECAAECRETEFEDLPLEKCKIGAGAASGLASGRQGLSLFTRDVGA